MLNNEKKRVKGSIDPFNVGNSGHRRLEMENDKEAIGGLDHRGSKLKIV